MPVTSDCVHQKLAKLEDSVYRTRIPDLTPACEYEKPGFCVCWSEGTPYLAIDYEALRSSFKGKLSKDWDEYFKIMYLETRRDIIDDAFIRSFRLLADRIGCIEKFLQAFPRFVKASQLKERLDCYVSAFTKGVDNSKPKDRPNEAIIAYKSFLSNCQNSAYRKQVKAALESLEKSPRRKMYLK
jgi:hypothetical protein